MSKQWFWKVLFIFIFISFVKSAKILGVFPVPSISHQCVFQPIWRELSLRGHQVTVVTPNPLHDPTLVNLTEIDVNRATYPVIEKHGFQFFMSKDKWVFGKIPKIYALTNELAELVFENQQFRQIYENVKDNQFDLVLVQTYISPIMYSLSAKFSAPVIGISSMGGYVGSHYAMGNPNHPAIYSEMFLDYNGDNLTFYERFISTLYAIWTRYYIHFHGLPYADQIMRKYLGEDMPYLGESERNVSMLFLNTNPVLYTPRPTVPTIIELGQMHIKPVKPLKPDLQKLLDDASEGIVYFSLGSNVKSVNMPIGLRQILIETFAELPYTVLWKWESDELPGKPANVITRKWLPQQDLLAHPNIKVFITQCGLQSTEEAISRGVPIVGIPFIADQTMNIKKLKEFGVALGVDYGTMTKDEFKAVIMEVMTNDKYRLKMKELRELLRDQPMTGLQRAVWWSEYVIRHKGTKHLRSPTLDISWWNYLLLDVLSVVLIAILFIVYMVYKINNYLRILLSGNRDKIKKN